MEKNFDDPTENSLLEAKDHWEDYLRWHKENNDEDFIKMYSYFSRGKIIIDEKETMYNLGSNQCNFIIQEKDTYDAYINHITYIQYFFL